MFYLLVIFAIVAVYADNTNITINYDKNLEPAKAKLFDIRGSTEIKCSAESDRPNLKVFWMVEDAAENLKPLSEDDHLKINTGKNYANAAFTRATENDAGTYYCVVEDAETNGELKREVLYMHNKYRIKAHDDVNAIEGEKFTLHCAVTGKPRIPIYWEMDIIGNSTFNDTRYAFKDDDIGVENAILIIKETIKDDRGVYSCSVRPEIGDTVVHTTMVRIKDKYAALWPFLGICAEVFILCAIILIYEKKRNKTELEESDTDQSPDQKNTPDNGKESNLRHRN